MEVTFNLNVRDSLWAGAYGFLRSPALRYLRWGIFVILPFFAALLVGGYYVFSSPPNRPPRLELLLMFVAQVLTLYWTVMGVSIGLGMLSAWYQLRKFERDFPLLFGDQSVTILPGGIRHVMQAGVSLWRWEAIRSVTEREDAIYVFIGPHVGVIIPKRAFATPDEAATFVHGIKTYWSQSRR